VNADQTAALRSVAALVIVMPGPATLLIALHAHEAGWRATHSAGGIVAGDLVLITLSGLGLSAISMRWPTLALGLTVTGAMYIAWLGLVMLRATPRDGDSTSAMRSPTGGFLNGFTLTLLNPKPILFFGAFFPLFIDRSADHWMGSFYLLGLVFEVINLCYFAGLIALVSRTRGLTTLTDATRGRIQKAGGLALLSCAALMLIGLRHSS
jgi:leucine efflux protein